MYKLLVIDDEKKIREGIVHHFPWESLGFEIAGDFANGQEAIDFLNTHEVDIVLTDISMPIMNGLTLAETLRDTPVKVVFFSSYQKFEYAQSALRNQVIDYLLKPIKYAELVACFERVRKMLDEERKKTEEPEDEPPAPYSEKIVNTIIEYLDGNLREASLESAAAQVMLSPSYVSRLFKKTTSYKFSDYLLKLRMEKALEMMNDVTLKQYEIAYRLGYDNPKTYSRVFKSYYGITPNEYRNNPSLIKR